jgi:hypothetical protein
LQKVVEQVFYYELLCIYAISALLIFVANYKLIFCAQLVVMLMLGLEVTFLILSQLELFNPDLCLVISLNA